MKQNYLSLLFAGAVAAGTLSVTSCSSDDDQLAEASQPATEVATPDYQQVLADATSQLGQELSALNMDNLAPLTRAINDGCECDCGCDCCQDDSTGADADADEQCDHKKFTEVLKELLNNMSTDFSREKPFMRSYAFEDMMKLLKLTWTATGYNSYGRENGEFYLDGVDGHTLTCEYVTPDSTNIYKATASVAVMGTAKALTTDKTVSRLLTIEKNDSTVLRVLVTNTKGEQRVLPFLPDRVVEHTGAVTINGMKVALDIDDSKRHEHGLKLTVSKESDSTPLVEMTSTLTDNNTFINRLKNDVVYSSDYNLSLLGGTVAISGKLNNVNAYLGSVPVLRAIYKHGANGEVCKNAATKFNQNFDIELIVAGSNIGKIILLPVYDSEKNNYTLEMFIDSPLLGQNPASLSNILAGLGFTVKGILDMIKGDAEA